MDRGGQETRNLFLDLLLQEQGAWPSWTPPESVAEPEYSNICYELIAKKLNPDSKLNVTVTAPDRCYCSNQAFLTVCAKGRAGEFPVGGDQ